MQFGNGENRANNNLRYTLSFRYVGVGVPPLFLFQSETWFSFDPQKPFILTIFFKTHYKITGEATFSRKIIRVEQKVYPFLWHIGPFT